MKKVLIGIVICLQLVGCSVNPAAVGDTAPSQTVPTLPSTEPPTTAPPDPMEALLDSMTVEEMVGQMFLARYPGAQAAVDGVKTYHIGGYILFGKDFKEETKASISSEISALQASSALPLIIGTDEEGGDVARVSAYPQFRNTRFSSPRKLYELGGLPLILDTEKEKCQLLASVGVNANIAPVCDVTTQKNAFMYRRSLGQDPETTGEFAAGVVGVMAQYRIGSVMKHFPGYGNNTDTHVGTVIDHRSLEELESRDLVPFKAGIEAGCDAILVSHTIVACLDETTPASLSPAAIAYLRSTMGFTGVIVTDDLVMDAISDRYGVGDSAVKAVLAGCDMLCSSDYGQQYTAVLAAVQEGRISQQQIRDAVRRILTWKTELGLLKL